MCFSSQASFIAAGLLSIIGFISIQLSRSKKEYLLALTPLLFAIQQALEGLIWIFLPQHTCLATLPTYGYLFFAFIFWPLWVPFIVINNEKGIWIKMALYTALAAGGLVSLFFARSLFIYGATATIAGNHISYTLGESLSFFMGAFLNCMYCIATVVPFFIARQPLFWLFGSLLSISYVISFIFYYQSFGSVWCFFAALLSSLIVYIIYSKHAHTTNH